MPCLMGYERDRKKMVMIWSTWCMAIATLVLLATALSLSISTTTNKTHIHTVSKLGGGGAGGVLNFFKTTTSTFSPNAGIVAACNSTLYPDVCASALAGASSANSQKDLFPVSVKSAKLLAASARAAAYNIILARAKSKSKAAPSSPPTACDDCLELLDISLQQLDDVFAAAGNRETKFHDIQTWLSAALTNQVTCSDRIGTAGVSPSGEQSLATQVNLLSKYISNALALHVSQKGSGRGGRRLSNRYPEWVTAEDRKLLEASPADIRVDAVVASDGSGTHQTISDAIAFVSLQSTGGGGGGGGRSVIYVKAGTYNEYIRIPTKQKNVMLVGDGKGKSIIIGGRNAEDGWSTYQSATVAAMGAGFIAKGVTIINSSGPNKHQAVALRVGGDQSVVYQCSIQGYQDTLYSYANRQFYRDCDISGTVDFIFGNSAAVFQNCVIQPKRPAAGQKNSITAQGRSDPNQNTGISIHDCQISGSTGGAPTYLGRPWKQYSRVVFIKTEIDGSVNSAGWEEWSGNFALSTLYYGEYGNTGAGAATSSRVRWPGVHPDMSAADASKFTVANFISGTSWLPGAGVVFTAGL